LRWLEAAWGTAATRPRPVGSVRPPGTSATSNAATSPLLGRLGQALDGPGILAEADAWYFILEGTREPSAAEAWALALTELAARTATSPMGQLPGDRVGRRRLRGRVPPGAPINLYERGRSLGHRRAGLRPYRT
jgi:hypothetical protein